MLTVSTLFEAYTIPTKKRIPEEKPNQSNWAIPAATVAALGGLAGYGGLKWYENEQRRRWESIRPALERMEKIADHIQNNPPKDDIFDTDADTKNFLFSMKHGAGINRTLSGNITSKEADLMVSRNPEDVKIDSDDHSINDLVADANNI